MSKRPNKPNKKYVLFKGLDQYFSEVHDAFRFTLRFFRVLFGGKINFQELLNQSYEVGVRTLPLITLTSFIVGIVFCKQSRPSLETFGASSWLPSLMGIAIIKALGPLITALISAGKVGSGIGAGLGSMRVTEQIEAMEVSAINPFRFLVVTRVLATTITIPVLMVYSSLISLLGAFAHIHAVDSSSFMTFYQNAFSTITFVDLFEALLKSIVYGFTIGLVSSFKGYNASQGTLGVGKAANQSVVVSMFLIFIEEILIVMMFTWFR